MLFGSVCGGIEAASVAWAPLGWKAAWLAEIEPFPSAVLAHHYPTVPNLGDMTKFKDWPDGSIDLLCGGTPCQSFSNAGLRAGLDDPRGQLMLTFGAIAARYRPRWLVWENVPGVLSSNGGRDFGAFLGLLGFLGYGFAYRVLDAQFVRVDGYGHAVPQRRQRVFVVGCLGDWRSAAAVLLEREGLQGHPAPRRSAGAGIAAGALAGTGSGSGWRVGADEAAAGQLIHAMAGGRESEIAGTLLAQKGWKGDAEAETFVAHTLRGEGFDASEDGTGRGTPLVTVHAPEVHPTMVARSSRGGGQTNTPGHNADETLIATGLPDGPGYHPMVPMPTHAALPFDTTQITSASNYSNPKAGDPCHPLAAGAHASAVAFGLMNAAAQGMPVDTISPTLDKSKHPATLAFSGKDYGADATADLAPTLRAMGHAGSHANGGGQMAVQVAAAVRRLMPVECERLQGFPDGYTNIPWRTWQEAARKGASYEGLLQARGMTLRGPSLEECPDGPRYKALGNSWAVNCARWIGWRISVVDQLTGRAAA